MTRLHAAEVRPERLPQATSAFRHAECELALASCFIVGPVAPVFVLQPKPSAAVNWFQKHYRLIQVAPGPLLRRETLTVIR